MPVLSLNHRATLSALFALGLLLGGCLDGGSSPSTRLCSDTCRYAMDGECDDGGEGATTGICGLGTDCGDCGVRGGSEPPPMEEGECPGGCGSDEVCVREHGCLSLCTTSSECASGCCSGLTSGRSACADASYCDDPMMPPDPMGGTPATLAPTTPTTSIPNTEACTGEAASADGELVSVNTPLYAGDTRVQSFRMRYRMSTIFGEPARNAAYAWEGTGGLGSVVWAAEVQTQDGASQYVTDSGQRVYASYIGGTFGDPGDGYGFDVSASPSWSETFVTYDGSQLVFGVSEEEAKRIYRGCFRLGELRVLEINDDPALHP